MLQLSIVQLFTYLSLCLTSTHKKVEDKDIAYPVVVLVDILIDVNYVSYDNLNSSLIGKSCHIVDGEESRGCACTSHFKHECSLGTIK